MENAWIYTFDESRFRSTWLPCHKMAEKLARSIKEEYLSCSICLEQFKQPKRLPCQHIFCQQCLEDHVKNTLTQDRKGSTGNATVHIACPLCRNVFDARCDKDFSVKTWISALPNDILINSLLQKLEEHEIDVSHHNIEAQTRCGTHGGKLREAFCFTHAHLVCWECAAREHRKCEVDSADKARPTMEPNIKDLRKEVCGQLVSAREMCSVDQDFSESKKRVISELNTLEKDINNILYSAKRQIVHLRAEIEKICRKQLEQRKGFYDVVTSLFEMNHTLESLDKTKDSVSMIAKLHCIQNELETAKTELSKLEHVCSADSLKDLVFIPDENMSRFINVYSGVGFVESGGQGGADHNGPTDAPMSIAHILNRSVSKETE